MTERLYHELAIFEQSRGGLESLRWGPFQACWLSLVVSILLASDAMDGAGPTWIDCRAAKIA